MQFEICDLQKLVEILDSSYSEASHFTMRASYAGNIATGNLPSDPFKMVRIHNTVLQANTEGWIEHLLSQIRDDERVQQKTNLLDEIDRLQAEIEQARTDMAVSGSDDPLNALKIGHLPFFNRGQLREALGRPHMAQGFIITGDTASGKTYSWNMIKMLAKKRQVRTIKVDLEDLVHVNCEPAEIMRVIVGRMGLDAGDVPNEVFAQNDRIGYMLTNWFVGLSQDFDDEWWICIDGLDKPASGQGAADMIGNLAKVVNEGDLRNVRLFVLGANPRYPLPSSVTDAFEAETASGVGRSVVRQHIYELAQAKQINIDHPQVDTLVNSLFDGLTSPIGHENMAEFKSRYKEQAEGAFAALAQEGQQ